MPAVLPQYELDRYHSTVAEQKQNDIRPVMLDLLRKNGVVVNQDQALSTQVMTWLEATFPLPEHEVVLTAEQGKILMSFESFADGLYPVGTLHKALRRLDPMLLPALLRTLEHLSAALHPTAGPVGMEAYAEYIWSVEQLAEFALPDRFEQHVGELTERTALNLARRLALPHEKLIRDQTPHVYFAVRDTPEQTVERLSRAVQAFPQQAVLQALAPLLELLPQLQQLSAAAPQMTETEGQKITFLPPCNVVLTPSPKPYCAVAECADEFMRSHWEGGEHSPHFALLIDKTMTSQNRALELLGLIPKFMACHSEVLRVISDAQDL